MNGNGSRPRNNLSAQFREHYEGVNWGTAPQSKLTQFGFQWGNCEVTRQCSFRGNWLALRTPWTKANSLDIHITPSGRIRIYGPDGKKWKAQ